MEAAGECAQIFLDGAAVDPVIAHHRRAIVVRARPALSMPGHKHPMSARWAWQAQTAHGLDFKRLRFVLLSV